MAKYLEGLIPKLTKAVVTAEIPARQRKRKAASSRRVRVARRRARAARAACRARALARGSRVREDDDVERRQRRVVACEEHGVVRERARARARVAKHAARRQRATARRHRGAQLVGEVAQQQRRLALVAHQAARTAAAVVARKSSTPRALACSGQEVNDRAARSVSVRARSSRAAPVSFGPARAGRARGNLTGAMQRVGSRIVAAVGAVCASALAFAMPAHAAGVRAGAAAVDANWHVGAAAGQYAPDGAPVGEHGVDPGAALDAALAVVRDRSRACRCARSSSRGPTASAVAIVKQDLYIPQDLLWRRTAQILEQGDSGHRQDEPDDGRHAQPLVAVLLVAVVGRVGVPGRLRRALLRLLREADGGGRRAGRRQPRAGARVAPRGRQLDKVARHSIGPAIADDGTPAGYPYDGLRHRPHRGALRLGRRSAAAIWQRSSTTTLHREVLEGNDLISGDYVAPLQRMRRPRDRRRHRVHAERGRHRRARAQTFHHVRSERLEFTHRQYAQAERAARLLADAALRRGAQPAGTASGRVACQLGDRLPGPDGRPLVPGAAVAPVPDGVELPHRPDLRRQPAGADRRPARLPAGPARRAFDADRSRPGRVDRRPRARGRPGARELRGDRLHRARGGPRRPPPGDPPRRHPARRSARASSGPTRAATSRRAPTRAQGNKHLGYDWGARCDAGRRRRPGAARTRATRPGGCHRSATTSTAACARRC